MPYSYIKIDGDGENTLECHFVIQYNTVNIYETEIFEVYFEDDDNNTRKCYVKWNYTSTSKYPFKCSIKFKNSSDMYTFVFPRTYDYLKAPTKVDEFILLIHIEKVNEMLIIAYENIKVICTDAKDNVKVICTDDIEIEE